MKALIAFLLLTPCLAFAEVSTLEAPLEPTDNLITIQVGFLANTDFRGSAARYSGYGIRYARTLANALLLGRDSLSLEGGVFYYKTVNYAIQGDAYTLLPLNAIAQYGFGLSDAFRVYGYGGVMKNWVVDQSNGSAYANTWLSGLIPALGVGLSVNIRGMIVRADIGTDLVGAGLAYAF